MGETGKHSAPIALDFASCNPCSAVVAQMFPKNWNLWGCCCFEVCAEPWFCATSACSKLCSSFLCYTLNA